MIAVLLGTCLCLLFYIIRRFNYWKRQGVPQQNAWTVLNNNVKIAFQRLTPVDNIIKTYSSISPNSRYIGGYQFLTPVLVVKDLDLIKQITIKDFEHFVDHRVVMTEECEPLWGKNILSLRGEKWKHMRTSVSPTFTSSKMKAMFGFMSECAQNFVHHFEKKSQTVTVELRDVYSRYANDVIASVAFGLNCDSLKEPNNEFYRMGKELTNISRLWTIVSLLLVMISHTLAKILGACMFTTEVTTFFRKLVKENMESREKNGIVRPDIIHYLMEAKKGKLKHEDNSENKDEGFAIVEEFTNNKTKVEKRQLTDDDLVAQAMGFFFAGFDSVSALMCFASYELAVDPLVQQRLQDEIDSTLQMCNGQITYDTLMKMEYMDMVISEALRKWPGTFTTDRVCVKPYTIQPEREGEKPLHLKKGDLIFLPMFNIHRDETLYPDPERFDPERFSPENRTSINPYGYLPFGIGPRACIGTRFALLESKILLFHVLSKFDIVAVEKSVIPLKLCTQRFSPSVKEGLWFGFKPRKLQNI